MLSTWFHFELRRVFQVSRNISEQEVKPFMMDCCTTLSSPTTMVTQWVRYGLLPLSSSGLIDQIYHHHQYSSEVKISDILTCPSPGS